MKTTLIYISGVLTNSLTGKQKPAGLWDFKINWPFWNALKSYSPSRIVLIDNSGYIKSGVYKDQDYNSRVTYIAHCLSEFLGLPQTCFVRYSYGTDWKLYPDYTGCQDTVLSGISKKQELEYIGRRQDFDWMTSMGVQTCHEFTDFIKKYGTEGKI